MNNITTTATGKIMLAPMEGVVDGLMRELLSSINCFDLCITIAKVNVALFEDARITRHYPVVA